MKVLFAVSDDSISNAIIEKYQKKYKELLSYKNVYYFDAILKEIQRDKSYDRIVISEDLEEFPNNNYDAIDKSLFEKLDRISDEATDIDGNDTPIIFICSDRRTKGSSFFIKIFGIGVYNALIGQERSFEEVCKLISKPRTKKEAKLYYKVDSDDVNYSQENDKEVSEIELQNIINHFKKLGKATDKFAASFESIAAQYTDEQLLIIMNCLPLNVKSVLEKDSEKYKEIMEANKSSIKSVNTPNIFSAEEEKKPGISSQMISSVEQKLNGPIVIPSSVKVSANRPVKPAVKPVKSSLDVESDNPTPKTKKVIVKKEEPKEEIILDEDDDEIEYVIQKKKFRRKDGTIFVKEVKVPKSEVEKKVKTKPVKKVEEVKKDDDDDDFRFPSLDDDDDDIPAKNDSNISNLDDDDDLVPSLEDVKPKVSDDDDDIPGLDEINLEDDDDDIPGLNDDEDDDDIPGISENNDDDDIPGLNDTDDDDIPGLNDSDDDDIPGLNDNDDDVPQVDDDTTDEVEIPGLDELDDDDDDSLLSNMDDDDDIIGNSNQSNEVESIRPTVDYSMSSLNSLLTKDKKIVTFIGTSKNGTTFLVNNLAMLFSAVGINTAILDMTQNRNDYYIFTDDKDELRKIAETSTSKLINGYNEGIKINNNLSVFTAIPGDKKDFSNAEAILSTLIQNYSLVLIDCDYDTDPAYFASCQEIYLVQTFDCLTMQPLVTFLNQLRRVNAFEPEKVRVVVNKQVKVDRLSVEGLVGALSMYSDPAMTVSVDLFNASLVKICTIPFDINVYSSYLNQVATCKLSISKYPKAFMDKLKLLGDMVYPLVGKGNNYGGNIKIPQGGSFGNKTNDTLNKMKNKF